MHSKFKAPTAFGKPLNTASYYETVNGIIAVLRPMSSLRVTAAHLAGVGLKTPSGLVWNRDRLNNYIAQTYSRTTKQ